MKYVKKKLINRLRPPQNTSHKSKLYILLFFQGKNISQQNQKCKFERKKN